MEDTNRPGASHSMQALLDIAGGMTMQHRRYFFKSIAGLFAVAYLDPTSLINKVTPDAAARIVAIHPTIRDQFVKLTHYMHAEPVGQLPQHHYPEVAGESKVSTDFPYHFGVDLDMTEDNIRSLNDEAIHQRYIMPVTASLANEIIRMKAKRFAQLPMPYSLDDAVRVSGGGVSLRGVRTFDHGLYEDGVPHWTHRFDVLFG